MKNNRRQSVWDNWPLKIGAALAHPVGDFMRSVCDVAREFFQCRAAVVAARTINFQMAAVGLPRLVGCCSSVVTICLASIVAHAYAANAVLTPSRPLVEACLPIDMPTNDFFFSAKKKVFAHYFSRFPLSIDNRDSAVDYYSREYLRPGGEHDKWLAQGGFLRSRPLPVPVGKSSEYIIGNIKIEIKLALSRGITGFTFDILSLDDIRPGSYLPNMLQAASEVDPRFKIILMPDMSALGPDTGNVITIIKAMYKQRGLFHLPNGRLVISPFLSESVSPTSWEAMKSQLAKDGIRIAFVPTFLSLPDSYIARYKIVSDGFGTFGTPLPRQGAALKANAKAVHSERKIFMAGISGQGYRPKDYRYWEAQGSLAYRSSWLGAIEGGADWIQLTTWNDFSESTQVLPYTDLAGSSGTGYFNLTGFYASWFVTGREPLITHDVLYYFYRKQSVSAAAVRAGKQVTNATASWWRRDIIEGSWGRDIIEVVSFLKSPGTLAISIGGKDYTKEVAAGVQSFSVALGTGTPRFSLLRNNDTVISFVGTTPIVGESGLPGGYADLTYWSGSASAKGTCFSDAIRW